MSTIPHLLVNADLSQAEARVVAYASGDKGLCDLFESGVDYHRANALNIWHLPSLEHVTPAQRQLAKMGGHASNYLITAPTLAKQLGIPLSEAVEFLRAYRGRYPGLVAWQDALWALVLKTRKVTNLYGRTAVILKRMDDEVRRSITAYVPQSTVTDHINRALLAFLADNPEGDWFTLLLQCHDSLLWSVEHDKIDRFNALLKPYLEVPIPINEHKTFIIPADFEVGANYKHLIRYATPEQEFLIRGGISKGLGGEKGEGPDLVEFSGASKDACSAIFKNQLWRTIHAS